MAAFRLVNSIRHFSSTAVTRGQLVKAPLAIFGTEGRYATALYSAAVKEKKLDAVEKELQDFQALIKTDAKFLDMILDPTLQKKAKKGAVENVLKKKNFSNLTINFFGCLADNSRLNKIQNTLSAFFRIMSAHRGEVVCEVITAKPLDEESKKELDTALQSFVKKGQVLKVETKVDPSIIGGMIVSIGDRYVDMSFSSKINTYANLLKQAL